MPSIRCGHCNAINDTERSGAYCEECGKKLPASTAFGTEADSPAPDQHVRPSRAYDDYPNVSLSPQRSEEQDQAARQVATILFVIALLQVICGSIAVFALPAAMGGGPVPPEVLIITLAIMAGIAVVFAGLGVWALYMPVPAGIIGLIFYIGIGLMDMVMAPETAFRGIVLKAIFVYVLIRAIAAAAKTGRSE